MDVRIRVPELFEEYGLTAYEIAKRSNGRLQASTLYRLARRNGEVDYISSELVETLADVLGIKTLGELLELEAKRGRGSKER